MAVSDHGKIAAETSYISKVNTTQSCRELSSRHFLFQLFPPVGQQAFFISSTLALKNLSRGISCHNFYHQVHGLIKYIDIKAKCAHKKYRPVKGLCGKGYRLEIHYSHSCWYFRSSFVNCCLANLLSGSTLLNDNHLPQSPFTSQFFQMTTFYIVLHESYLSTTTVCSALG